MTEPISRGDRYDIPFTVNGNLTGATTRFLAARHGTVVELAHTITDATSGVGKLTDTSALAVGTWAVELEAVNGLQKITYRAGSITIVPDLG